MAAQVSTKSVLRKTLDKISAHHKASGKLDTRFSNHYKSKTREDLSQAMSAASKRARA